LNLVIHKLKYFQVFRQGYGSKLPKCFVAFNTYSTYKVSELDKVTYLSYE